MRREPPALPIALTHPLWWSALGLLVLNDHALKGAGVLPGAWTGKLSDFAGVIVAPALLAALLRAGHGVRRRLLASGLVGAALCAIKTLPWAASALEGAFHAVRLPAAIVVDPSDLFALLALPLGHVLSRPRAAASATRPGERAAHVRWIERGAIVLSALACLASIGSEKKKTERSDAPEVENSSDETIVVVVASTEGRGGCKLYRSDRLGALTADAFRDPRLLTLEPGERASLAVSDDEVALACGAASIRLADGEQTFVAWRDLGAIDGYVPSDDGERRARRVLVDGLRGRYEVEVGKDLIAFEPGLDAPVPSCPELPAEPTLAFSPLPEAQGFLEVQALDHDMDGCLVVTWLQLEGEIAAGKQTLCIPDWAFPFEAGESLAVTQGRNEVEGTVLQVARLDESALDVQLSLWNGATDAVSDRVSSIEPVDCVGALTACGAYVRPLQLHVEKQDQPLVSGDELTLEGKGGASRRLLVGSSRDVGWSGVACEGDEAIEGPRFNLLELRTF